MISRERRLAPFDQVRFNGPGTLKISQCDQESLTITAPEYMLPDIESSVSSGTLRLGYQRKKIVSLQVHREPVVYDLGVRDLKALELSGSGQAAIPDLDGDSFSLVVSGSGNVLLSRLTADHLEVNLAGNGSLTVAGDVERLTASLSGSGSLAAADLVSDFAQIVITGSGHAAISASEELNARISGSGTISYAGYPEVVRQISGSGKLIRRRNSRQQQKGKEHG